MTGLRPQLESKFSDVHSHRAPSWKITCRTVQVFPECLRLSTIPAVHCIVAAKGFSKRIQNKLHSPTVWASWIPSTPKKKLPIHVRRLCCSRAPRAVQQCNSLQCSLVHGSGRLNPTPLTEQDRSARGTRQQDSQDKQKKRIQGQTTLPQIREGREEVTVAGVCV